MPEYTATHRFARISPRKIRLVLDMVRGREVDDALNILRFSKQRGSVFVERAVKSAVANYYDQQTTPGQDTLIISEARADEGPTIKRFQPKDRGKAHPIMKRTSHVVVSVSDGDDD
ncbi:MAG: 50S ribosomal protein L22 [Planctomycetota bacterium]